MLIRARATLKNKQVLEGQNWHSDRFSTGRITITDTSLRRGILIQFSDEGGFSNLYVDDCCLADIEELHLQLLR